jgi:sec-independent protein translocase protein TatC
MAKVLRPVNHDARLSLVEHLDELRTRLIVSIGALIVAFGVCFWQNHRLLNLLERPIHKVLESQAKKGEGLEGEATQGGKALHAVVGAVANFAKQLAKPGSGVSPGSAVRPARSFPNCTGLSRRSTRAAAHKLTTLGSVSRSR